MVPGRVRHGVRACPAASVPVRGLEVVAFRHPVAVGSRSEGGKPDVRPQGVHQASDRSSASIWTDQMTARMQPEDNAMDSRL